MMANVPAYAAYLVCVVSVAIYAHRRLNTPTSNRSSTRLRLYRQAALGYVVCTLILFVVLSSALQYQARDRLLMALSLNNTGQLQAITALPAPLIATVVLTLWLPNVVLIRDVDGWLLNGFKSRANIPQEVRSRADRLEPKLFRLTPADLPGLEKLIEDEGLPDSLPAHLQVERTSGLQLSQYRLTRVLKLFGQVRQLHRDPDCQRFFLDYDEEWAAAQNDFTAFCERATTGLEKARKLHNEVSPGQYESLMTNKRESFGETTRLMFGQLALLAAGAVLCKEATEHAIGERLRAIGFSIDDEPELPEFPLRSLSGLAIFLLLYLVVTDLVLQRLHLPPGHPDLRSPVADSARPLFILVSYAVTIGVTVWLIERSPQLQRTTDGRLRWDVYVLCMLIGAAILAMLWLGLFLLRYQDLPHAPAEWNMLFAVAVLVGSLSGAVACCCDISSERFPESVGRRLAEGTGCLVFMALVAGLLLIKVQIPISVDAAQSKLTASALVLLPASVAFIVGWFVPHICRSERMLAHRRSNRPPVDRPSGIRGSPATVG